MTLKLQVVRQIPPPEQQNPIYQYITIENLPNVPDEVFTDIELNDTLDYIETRLVALEIAIKKLRSKGQLSFLGIDIVEIAKAIVVGNITIEDANKLFYFGKKSIDNIFRIKVLMSNLNLRITDCRLNDFTYYMKAEKQ